MRVFSICRNCAEVHRAEIECPACQPAEAARAPRRHRGLNSPLDRAAPLPALAPVPVRPLFRASTLVVSAYLLAVLVLILAVVAQA